MTTSQKRALRASLLELARLIAGTLLIAAAVVLLPFLFAILAFLEALLFTIL